MAEVSQDRLARSAHSDLTVAFRVTDGAWGQRAAACATMLCQHCQPERIVIQRYGGGEGRESRYSSGYNVLAGFSTTWLLAIDADSYVYGNVRELVKAAIQMGVKASLRLSPLQAMGRNGWDEEGYKALFERVHLPYRRLGTTCAFLLHRDVADLVLGWTGQWRKWLDQRGIMLSKSYHMAQVAFAMALAGAGVDDDRTGWWDPTQVSFAGEPHGIIHHEALKSYRFPFNSKTNLEMALEEEK